MKIKLDVKDDMDVALLLSGINLIRQMNLSTTHKYLSLPKEFDKSKILPELVDDYDRLNTLGAQLSKMLEKNKHKEKKKEGVDKLLSSGCEFAELTKQD